MKKVILLLVGTLLTGCAVSTPHTESTNDSTHIEDNRLSSTDNSSVELISESSESIETTPEVTIEEIEAISEESENTIEETITESTNEESEEDTTNDTLNEEPTAEENTTIETTPRPPHIILRNEDESTTSETTIKETPSEVQTTIEPTTVTPTTPEPTTPAPTEPVTTVAPTTVAPTVPETTVAPTTEAVYATHISVSMTSGKKMVGDTLKASDFLVIVTFSDGTHVNNPEGWAIDNLKLNSESNVINITYQNLKATMTIPAEKPVEIIVKDPIQSVKLPSGYSMTDSNHYYIPQLYIYKPEEDFKVIHIGTDTLHRFINSSRYDFNRGKQVDDNLYQFTIFTGNPNENYETYMTKHYDVSTLKEGWNNITFELTDESAAKFGASTLNTWFYMSSNATTNGNIGKMLQVFDWQNKERAEHGVAPLIWDDDLYTIARYRAWQEHETVKAGGDFSHSRKLTIGENLIGGTGEPASALIYFNKENPGSSSAHSNTLNKSIYTYGAIASYGGVTIYVYETNDWHNRVDEYVKNIRAAYGDMFDVKR